MTQQAQENEQKLDRVSEIAKQKLESLQKAKKESEANKQQRDPADPPKEPPKQTAEEIAAKEKAEKEANEKQRILTTEDSKLSSEELAQKTAYLEAQEEEKLTPEQKKVFERQRSKMQKRFDEMTKKNDDLEKRLALIEASKLEDEKIEKVEVETKTALQQLEEKRKQMAIEDEAKPFKERREMSEEALQEFYLEDPVGCTTWINRQTLRHDREESNLSKEAEQKQKLQENGRMLNESRNKLVQKFPAIDKAIQKGVELTRLGYKDDVITEKLRSEFGEYALMLDIISEDEDKYLTVNGPELVADEMARRIKENPIKQGARMYSEEEVQERIQKEHERLARIDAGLGGGNKPPKESNYLPESDKWRKSDPLYDRKLDKFLEASRRAGRKWTEKDFVQTLEYGQKNKGAKGSEKDTD